PGQHSSLCGFAHKMVHTVFPFLFPLLSHPGRTFMMIESINLRIVMSIDKSLRRKNSLQRARNVLTRGERIKILRDEERWPDGRSPFGLPKVKVIKIVVKKAKKKEEENRGEGGEGAGAARGGARAAAARAGGARGAAAAAAKAPAAGKAPAAEKKPADKKK